MHRIMHQRQERGETRNDRILFIATSISVRSVIGPFGAEFLTTSSTTAGEDEIPMAAARAAWIGVRPSHARTV